MPSGGAPEAGAPPPLPPTPKIDELHGMTREAVAALFGVPVFTRNEPLAEFWRYRAPDCRFELYFYPRDGKRLVDHVDVLGDRDEAECLALVMRSREVMKRRR